MEVAADFAPFHERVTSALINATRTTGQLVAEDLSFHRSFDPTLSKSLDEKSQRLLDLTSSILKIATAGSDLKAPVLEDEDSVEENWRGIVDVVDELLEKADACLDEFTGIIKKLTPAQHERGLAVTKTAGAAQFPSIYDHGRSKIPKPQTLFDNPPDNSDSPFKPLLKSKPHAIVPLSESLGKPPGAKSTQSYDHPYRVEITTSRYPSFVYTKSPPQMYHPFDSTTATFVDTFEGVEAMLAELKTVKEIAVDLEHHDMHSYQGIVCLMQISTRDKDWIVDTLKPWREKLQILNEVLADPNILKVLHGSNKDIIWLQRDLGLYVVGLFDTYHAAVALHYEKRSLKYLLQKIVNFEAEKRYQMADWRLRPLLPGMFDYARSDTHYLLYIYDHLRNELLERSTPKNDLIDHVLKKSKEEALQRYEKPTYNPATGKGNGGWYDAISKSAVMFNREQFAVFRAVHKWRDDTARAEDESVQSVLSKSSLFKIAAAMPLDPPSLLNLASPVSPELRKRVSELIAIIKEAKASGATGPELQDVLKVAQKPATESLKTHPPPEQALESASSVKAEVSRATVSQFWGSTVLHDELPTLSTYCPSASFDALQLSLPLPSIPAGISVAAPVQDENPADLAPPTPDTAPKQATNEIFTVKQFGPAPKKRKSEVTEEVSTSSAAEDSSARSTPFPERPQAKKQKTSKTATRKEGQEESTPFDYTTAKSVLHADVSDNSTAQARPKFNPYVKAMDAPQGMRKVKKDIGGGGGKSITFRK
ncbi:hypothetical protein VTO42DRAFT_3212 [Malbranchea cinnamomea]